MKDAVVCDRYARALFKLSESRNEWEKIESDFDRICRVLSENPEIDRVANNPFISDNEKSGWLAKIFSGSISNTLLDFLNVLIEKKRFENLQGIRDEYHRLFEIKRGIREVTVTTAVPLSESNRNALRNALTRKLRSEIHMICRTDPKMIGGLILNFDGFEIDSSYQTYLTEMRQKLMV